MSRLVLTVRTDEAAWPLSTPSVAWRDPAGTAKRGGVPLQRGLGRASLIHVEFGAYCTSSVHTGCKAPASYVRGASSQHDPFLQQAALSLQAASWQNHDSSCTTAVGRTNAAGYIIIFIAPGCIVKQVHHRSGSYCAVRFIVAPGCIIAARCIIAPRLVFTLLLHRTRKGLNRFRVAPDVDTLLTKRLSRKRVWRQLTGLTEKVTRIWKSKVKPGVGDHPS